MNYKLYLLAIILVTFHVSCSTFSESKSAQPEEVFFDDDYKNNKTNEVVLGDKAFSEKDLTRRLEDGVSRDTTEIVADGSKISIAYDGFGNKTETRCFNDLRLKCLQLKTPASGQKEIFVFGHNGQTKKLPDNMLDKVLTASASEIANAAGIYDFKRETNPPTITLNNPQTSQSLQPMPSYKFPVPNQQSLEKVEQTELPNDDASADGQTSDNQTGEKPEKPTQNLQTK
jgi:hypothetical protein